MALVFIDSFDHYANADAPLKNWTFTNGALSAGNGRRGTTSLNLSSNGGTCQLAPLTPAPSGTTCIFGHSMKIGGTLAARDPLWSIRDGANTHVRVALNADGSLTAKNGNGTTLGSPTAAGVIVATVQHYVEIKATIDDTAGVVVIKVDSVQVLSLSSQDTRNAGVAQWTNILFSGMTNGVAQHIDDLYVFDGTGSVNNNFAGDIRVDAHFPTGNGNTSNSTPSTGSDRGATTDEAAPNGDTDYNTIVTVSNKDTLAMANLAASGSSILGIQTLVYAKKTDAGTGSMKIVTRSGSTDFLGTDTALATSYTYTKEVRETDPNTSAQWTETNFNAMEIGYQRTA